MAERPEKGSGGGSEALAAQLGHLFDVVLEQVRQDPTFAQRVASVLAQVGEAEGAQAAQRRDPTPVEPTATPADSKPSPRPAPARANSPAARTPAPAAVAPEPAPRNGALIDPFALYDAGWEPMLRAQLGKLSLEQLRDVIQQYELDPDGRSGREKDVKRLRDQIVLAVEERGMRGL